MALQGLVQAEPGALAPRLVLAQRLLDAGREGEAFPHLRILDEQGVGEASYYLGVACVRAGRLDQALTWMERARALDPDHPDTQQQIASLKRALGADVATAAAG